MGIAHAPLVHHARFQPFANQSRQNSVTHPVLEKFPQLYKVKCLRPDATARVPGLIELVVIPDIKNRLPFNPFEPKVPADLIRDIEAFLRDKTPPFARVEVKNAHYVPVKVRCGVRFMPGRDQSFCRAVL